MSVAVGGSCIIGLSNHSAFRSIGESKVKKPIIDCLKIVSDKEKSILKEKFDTLVIALKEQRQQKQHAKEVLTATATRAAFMALVDAIDKEEVLLKECEKAFDQAVEAGCYPDIYDPETDKIISAVGGKKGDEPSLEELD